MQPIPFTEAQVTELSTQNPLAAFFVNTIQHNQAFYVQETEVLRQRMSRYEERIDSLYEKNNDLYVI